ncbi:MAG: type I secretion system permease/ATPase [Hyphomicrobiaceae bacterium]
MQAGKQAGTGQKAATPLTEAFKSYRRTFVPIAIFSIFANLLMFVGPVYMLEVYDRVIASRSVPTLLALTMIAAVLLFCYALTDMVRGRVLSRAGAEFDEKLRSPLFRSALAASLAAKTGNSVQSLRDLDSVRDFWSGAAVSTMFDAPFAPIFVAVCFWYHPVLGLVALGGAILLFLLAFANERATRQGLLSAARSSIEANNYVTATMRNVEVIHALGMQQSLHGRWVDKHRDAISWQSQSSDRAASILSSTKFVRQFVQSGILGVGAWLTVRGDISGGTMIAASIMMGRALQPVEQAVAQWKGFQTARQAWNRLEALLGAVPPQPERTPMPAPKGAIAAENVTVTAPGRQQIILKGVSFALTPGDVLAIVGPSAAGKSTLARTLVGVWPIASGAVRIDGSDLRHWDPERLGLFMGYLPQDVELFGGTIGENIARFRASKPEDIRAAATLAGAAQLIEEMPKGYDTDVGDGGVALSAGQRQRVGLARAVFGNPRLVVLDEPNANLDVAGDEALSETIRRLKGQGTTTVLVTHKPSLVTDANKMLVLADGAVKLFGPRDQVMAELNRQRQQQQTGKPVAPVPAAAGATPLRPVRPQRADGR